MLILTHFSVRVKGVYDPRAFILHAALRRQTFVHCVRFPVAATRRCIGRVSVLFCPFPLSGRVPVIGLVGHYPTNYLMGDRLIHRRAVKRFSHCWGYAVLAHLSMGYSTPLGRFLSITQPFATRSLRISFYLHALGMPPALILGQDQTLKKRSKPN